MSKKTPAQQFRDKADKLLTPIIKKLHPKCESCGLPTQVAHHFIEKSRSSNLRYDIDLNLIPLCNSCHTKIHNLFGSNVQGSYSIVDNLIRKRGQAWYNKVNKLSTKIIKADIIFYESNYRRLNTIHTKLENATKI